MNTPSFSVVIPTYNRGPIVSQGIESILAQTVLPREIIVVDDGSTDNTREVLTEFGEKIITVFQPNGGVSAARNTGIKRASSDWVAFLDSDDVWHPNRIEVLRDDLMSGHAGVHVSNILMTGPGFRRELFELRGLQEGNGVWPLRRDDGFDIAMKDPYLSAVAVRRDWLEAIGCFDVSMPYCEDVDLLCRLVFLGPWLANATIVGELRRIGPSSESLSHRMQQERVFAEEVKRKTFGKLLQSLPENSPRSKMVRRMISMTWFNTAKTLDAGGHRRHAAASLVRSAREHPQLIGWGRAIVPLLIGNYGYKVVAKLRKPKFYRDPHVGT
jgi:glycosyltransferase involved in cell wall biosynthesis